MATSSCFHVTQVEEIKRIVGEGLSEREIVGPDGLPVSGGLSGSLRVPPRVIGGESMSLADITALSGAPTITLETGPNGQPAVKVVTGVGAVAEVQFPGLVGSYFWGDAYLSISGSYTTSNLDFTTLYWSQDNTSYATGGNQMLQYALTSPVDLWQEQGGVNTYWFRKGRHTAFGTPTYPGYIGQMKLRVAPRAGLAATVWIYGFALAAPATKGRICVTWDDGYSSFFGLGYQAFASRGIPQTLSVIGSAQDAGGTYSTTQQLRDFLAAGNALVAHGPWPAQGVGNLWSAYGGTGAADAVSNAVADMVQNRKWLADRGLLIENADKCYVWPQGAYQRSANDTALLDAAIAAGFTVGRSVGDIKTHSIYSHGYRFDAASKYGRLTLPIIGHSWAGTTAAEATNITNITTAITNIGASKGDACLMFHRVQASNTADGSMSSIGIRVSDLETIAAAVKAQVDAGNIECVTMPQLVIPANQWAI